MHNLVHELLPYCLSAYPKVTPYSSLSPLLHQALLPFTYSIHPSPSWCPLSSSLHSPSVLSPLPPAPYSLLSPFSSASSSSADRGLSLLQASTFSAPLTGSIPNTIVRKGRTLGHHRPDVEFVVQSIVCTTMRGVCTIVLLNLVVDIY